MLTLKRAYGSYTFLLAVTNNPVKCRVQRSCFITLLSCTEAKKLKGKGGVLKNKVVGLESDVVNGPNFIVHVVLKVNHHVHYTTFDYQHQHDGCGVFRFSCLPKVLR